MSPADSSSATPSRSKSLLPVGSFRTVRRLHAVMLVIAFIVKVRSDVTTPFCPHARTTRSLSTPSISRRTRCPSASAVMRPKRIPLVTKSVCLLSGCWSSPGLWSRREAPATRPSSRARAFLSHRHHSIRAIHVRPRTSGQLT